MMYISTEFVNTPHYRKSKYGTMHTYMRKKSVLVMRCDSCQSVFRRDKGNMDPKRVSDKYYHVCGSCDAKKFAQSKGVEARRVWDMPASSLKTLGQL